jgi:uncharacterized repeat protein (TIGR04138 family)
MQRVDFEEEIAKIVAKDSRYPTDAYAFVREALDQTQKNMGKPTKNELRHVTGQQLLGGIRDHAMREYGPMARTVLEEWNITRCEDFGEIVFNMVENGLLAKTKKDSRTDFAGGYDFDDAFRKPFLPQTQTFRRLHQPNPKTSEENRDTLKG